MPDTNYFGCCGRIRCLNVVLAIISTLFFFTLGLILGTAFNATFSMVLPILIVAAVILALLYLIFLIIKLCNN